MLYVFIRFFTINLSNCDSPILTISHVKTTPVPTTIGTYVPLGFERLKICELLAEVLHCANCFGTATDQKDTEVAGDNVGVVADMVRKQFIDVGILQCLIVCFSFLELIGYS